MLGQSEFNVLVDNRAASKITQGVTTEVAGQDGSLGNISAAPQFCAGDPGSEKFWAIQSDSPCAPAQSSCGLIGAWDIGCNTTGTVRQTWGGLKADYR